MYHDMSQVLVRMYCDMSQVLVHMYCDMSQVLVHMQCYSWANHGMGHFPFISNKREISMGHSL